MASVSHDVFDAAAADAASAACMATVGAGMRVAFWNPWQLAANCGIGKEGVEFSADAKAARVKLRWMDGQLDARSEK